MTQDIFDEETFQQLLDLDDDDKHEFSRSMVEEFFVSTIATIDEMKRALASNDYVEVSHRGHYMKGGAAGVGAAQVRDICEHIQTYETACKNSGEYKRYFEKLFDQLIHAISRSRLAFQARLNRV